MAAAALAMAGCIPPAPRAPAMAELAPEQVAAVDLVFVGGLKAACVHGAPAQLRAVVRYADGRQVSTWAAGEARAGKLDFAALEWGSDLGVVDAAGYLRWPADPFAVLGRRATVRVQVPGRAQLAATAELAPRFDCDVQVPAGGAPGPGGHSGWGGQPGSAGRVATESARAGDGGDGGHGERGSDGGHGGHGPRVEVALAYADGGEHGRLVLARVGSRHFLLAAGRSIFVSAAGGAGGAGGRGGDGGAGGRGGSARTGLGDGGHGGRGGDGGDGGRGGDGGDGGAIRVRYDQRHPELAELVRGSTAAGRGGAGGPGGRGGAGGAGGSSADGQRGQAGPAGREGQAGAEGRPGRAGAALRAEEAALEALFAAEIARGLPVGEPR